MTMSACNVSTKTATTVSPQIEASWKMALAPEFKQGYFSKLKQFMIEEKTKTCYCFSTRKRYF